MLNGDGTVGSFFSTSVAREGASKTFLFTGLALKVCLQNNSMVMVNKWEISRITERGPNKSPNSDTSGHINKDH